MGVIRPQTEAEKDLTPGIDGNTTGFISLTGTRETAEVKFKKQLNEEIKKAGNKYPFADQVALADFKDHYDREALASMRKNGFVKAEDIKPFEIDWKKYSDKKMFKLIDKKDTIDKFLTGKYKIPVYLKTEVYKYKNFSKKYRLMEDGIEALQRARKEE